MKISMLVLLFIVLSENKLCYSEIIQHDHTRLMNLPNAASNEQHSELRYLLKDALHSALRHHRQTHDHLLTQARKQGGYDMKDIQRVFSQNRHKHIKEWLISNGLRTDSTIEQTRNKSTLADISNDYNFGIEDSHHLDKSKDLQSNRQRRESGGVMYMPIGGGSSGANCPDAVDAAAVSISQLTFLSMALGVFSAVANIANNINNNNNNNNNNDDNNINSNNVNLAANANVGNQINVQLPPGRRRRRRNDRNNSRIDSKFSENLNKRLTENVSRCDNGCQNSTSIAHGWAAFKSIQAAQTWLDLSTSTSGAMALSPSCLGRNLCQIMKTKHLQDSWTHALAGYHIYQNITEKPQWCLKDYFNEAAQGNCSNIFPYCNVK